MKRILIAEDDVAIQELIEIYIDKEKYETILANDGEEALNKFYHERPDLILLDINMPKKNGIEICNEIRKVSLTPIIFVTSRCESVDMVNGLHAGADDYVTKPFDMNVLTARIDANLRYKKFNREVVQEPIRISSLEFDYKTHEVRKNGIKVELNPRELRLLFYMVEKPNEIISAEKLYEEVWNADSFGDTLTVSVHISRIRKKIEENAKKPSIIKTVKGKGYLLVSS